MYGEKEFEKIKKPGTDSIGKVGYGGLSAEQWEAIRAAKELTAQNNDPKTPIIEKKSAEKPQDKETKPTAKSEKPYLTLQAKNTPTTIEYLSGIGLKIYQEMRHDGFSIQAAALVVAQRTQEAGWVPTKDAIEKHNYFGMKSGGSLVKFNSDEEGLNAWKKMINTRYGDGIVKLYKSGNDISSDEVNQGLHTGPHVSKASYSYDYDRDDTEPTKVDYYPGGDKRNKPIKSGMQDYGHSLMATLKAVLDRWPEAIQNKMSEVDKNIELNRSVLKTAALAEPEQVKMINDAIDKLQAQKEELQKVLKEIKSIEIMNTGNKTSDVKTEHNETATYKQNILKETIKKE